MGLLTRYALRHLMTAALVRPVKQDSQPVAIHRFLWLFFLAFPLLPPSAYAGPDMPAMMILTGRVAPGAMPDSAAPGGDDQVLAFSSVDGQLVGSGPVSPNGGWYMTVLTRTSSFNGTPVVLELQQGRRRFQLLQNGMPVWLPFKGRLLPERTVLDLRVGVKTSELSAAQAANPQAQRLSQHPDIPCTPELDVNEDGKCDEADWDIVGLYGGGILRSVAHPGDGE